MKLLPESFTKNGFSHHCEFREGNVAIYKRQKGAMMPHWEAVVVREHKERAMQTPSGAIMLPHAEVYPSSEQWGTYGWTFLSFEEARTKAETLLCDQAIKNLTHDA